MEADDSAVAKMRQYGSVHGIGQKGFVLNSTSLKVELLEVRLHVADCIQGGFRSGEVRMQREGAEVGGNGVVRGRREESFEGSLGISR